MTISDAICPFCEAGRVTPKLGRDYSYQDETIHLATYESFVCDECGEEFVDAKANAESSRKIIEFQRQVDGLLSAAEIIQCRKQYGLNQKEFADLLGVAEKSFARWETSTVKQGTQIDNLLRTYLKYPKAVDALADYDTYKLKIEKALSKASILTTPSKPQPHESYLKTLKVKYVIKTVESDEQLDEGTNNFIQLLRVALSSSKSMGKELGYKEGKLRAEIAQQIERHHKARNAEESHYVPIPRKSLNMQSKR
ncbi:type II toxin-antitoxin system MqsA family antitoxin [Halodesulfovibrio spirochaetisodalis]|uniref:HTH cro/C1-type domain-containing protein n=1 Tax=Halodesulfovibrio spirochaetisodalis TaxID=1560234 RepID=A0A1B7XA35_9BACT|nr:type II toxin-antitoxin system MqsA family antitoxin [Halodesulfovibrio spirochaetisodalis]OBQ46235.1 hypothetical protein SP90_13645 [Halodesulfovibrio spirochaetisodalis]